MLETDKRALTRIKSGNDVTAAGVMEQKSLEPQKSLDQGSVVSADRKSTGSIVDNPELSLDSPSLNRKANDSPTLNRKTSDEELWYDTKCYQFVSFHLLVLCNKFCLFNIIILELL